MNKLQKSVIYAFIFLFTLAHVLPSAYAFTGSCTGREDIYNSITNSVPGSDLGKTLITTGIATIVETTTHVFVERNISDVQKCALLKASSEDPSIEVPSSCSITEAECRIIMEGFSDENVFNNSDPQAHLSGGGGLLGLLNVADYTISGGLPVDAAYAWNRNIEKIPFVKTAFAAPEDYSGPFLDLTYGVAQISKDIALVLIAMIMLVVGIMIITGKKISAQAAVSVQLALPRIAVAIVLIFFSYTIGAIGASLAYNMRWSMDTFVADYIVPNLGAQPLNAVSSSSAGAGVIFMLVGVVLAAPWGAGLGLGVFIAVLAGGVVAAFLYLMVWFEFVKIYFNILVSIVMAPITFALGALPGNDGTVKWFKGFGANVLSIPAMGLVVSLTLNVAWHIGISIFSLDIAAIFTTLSYSLLLGPLVLIYGLGLARSIPAKMQAAFGVGGGGDKKKDKK